jgi:hypothetical protein
MDSFCNFVLFFLNDALIFYDCKQLNLCPSVISKGPGTQFFVNTIKYNNWS